MTADGMASRLGTESRSSQALTHRHILWNQKFRAIFLRKTNLILFNKYEYVAAQCAELIAWLGWLRSRELFSLQTSDIELVSPAHSEKYGLPPMSGAILLRLLSSTKSSRNKRADIVIAWKAASGFCLGEWLSYLLHLQNLLG